MGRSAARAAASASSPQGYQSTGLWACWRKYGLDSAARRLVCLGSDMVDNNTIRWVLAIELL